jgi:hypothetical protein
MVKIFPRAADQVKKGTFKGALVHQILFQGNEGLSLHYRIKRSDIKFLFARRGPTKLVLPSSSPSIGVQKGIKGGHDIHLPIVSQANKANIPLKGATRIIILVATSTSFTQAKCYIKLEKQP